jgi:RHS repeat-associated protein
MRRLQTTAPGYREDVCYSYPCGDGLTCTGTDTTEHHFTGKERDAESGLDYFAAKYLSFNLARFMAADWAAKPIRIDYCDVVDDIMLVCEALIVGIFIA